MKKLRKHMSIFAIVLALASALILPNAVLAEDAAWWIDAGHGATCAIGIGEECDCGFSNAAPDPFPIIEKMSGSVINNDNDHVSSSENPEFVAGTQDNGALTFHKAVAVDNPSSPVFKLIQDKDGSITFNSNELQLLNKITGFETNKLFKFINAMSASDQNEFALYTKFYLNYAQSTGMSENAILSMATNMRAAASSRTGKAETASASDVWYLQTAFNGNQQLIKDNAYNINLLKGRIINNLTAPLFYVSDPDLPNGFPSPAPTPSSETIYTVGSSDDNEVSTPVGPIITPDDTDPVPLPAQ